MELRSTLCYEREFCMEVEVVMDVLLEEREEHESGKKENKATNNALDTSGACRIGVFVI